MARYFVQSTHNDEDCLKSLDDLVAQSPNLLTQFDFGCATGDHTNHVCFATIEAPSEAAARSALPERVAAKAEITEVGKFTADQVRSFHSN